VERGHFSNWNWAIEQSDSFISNGRHLRDWFIVDRAAIDKHDPDCVWRKVKVDKTRSIRIDGILRSFREGEHFYVIWSPVRAMALYLKLQLPLRTFQVRMLDSGEADTWRYESGQWIKNDVNDFVEGSEKRPWQKGVF
ncbi:hypothetical protein EAY29_20925, partial [Vibrio anguillarum]